MLNKVDSLFWLNNHTGTYVHLRLVINGGQTEFVRWPGDVRFGQCVRGFFYVDVISQTESFASSLLKHNLSYDRVGLVRMDP